MYVFDKTYYPHAGEKEFLQVCSELESQIPNLSKGKLIQDVDGSNLQSYYLDNKEIIVFDDCEVDAIYLKSEIDLEPFFKK